MKTTGKHLCRMLVLSLVLALTDCAMSLKASPAVSGLLSMDEAIEAAAMSVEERVAICSEIALYKITAFRDEIRCDIEDGKVQEK